MKKCSICKVEDRYKQYSYCKECQANFSKKWNLENKDYVKNVKAEVWKNTPIDKRYDRHLKQRYGITNDDYLKMFNEQDGVCKICRGESVRSRLSVDHDHSTGQVRGLLCERCNSILGRVKDNPEILESSAKYLRYWVAK